MKTYLVLMCAVFALSLSNCAEKAWRPGEPLPREKVKIGVLHISEPRFESSGYSYAHFVGIENMRKNIGLGEEQVLHAYNIADTDSLGIENAMRDFIARGVNIVIAPSWGYMDSCEKLSGEFPGVVFAHCSGYKFNDTNFTNYFGRVYQARYLSGIAAGLKTASGRIGYVAAMGRDSSEVSGGINAFALGVELVNPEARVYVKVTHSWFDPMGETDAARALIAAGCDVLAQHCDTSHPQLEAEKAGIWGIGYNSDMMDEAPGAVLTSVVWHWEDYYMGLVRGVIDGTFTTRPYFGGIREGVTDITELSGLAAPGTAEWIRAERERITAGAFNVFDGELRTNDGRIIGTKGETLSDSEIQGGIDWYYHTVIEE
jgi:basic membrane protein A